MQAPRGPRGSLTAVSIGPALISLSWPIFCSGVADVLDASVNVMWVGRRLGEVALAALSNANLLWGLLFVGAFGISMAGTVWIAKCLGEGDTRGAKAAVGTMVSAAVVVSLIGVLPMILWARALLRCLGTPLAAQSQAVEYLRILLLSVPPIYLIAAVIAVLQASGDSKTGLYLAVGTVTIDALLNPLLITGVSPFPSLGIAGSALATVVSQVICVAVLLIHVYRAGHPLRLLRNDLRPLVTNWGRTVRLLCDGAPMAAQVLWVSVENMLMISLVNRFGADVTAAYGTVVQLWNLIIMPATALGVATTAMVAQNVGAGHWDRVRSVTRLGLKYGVLATALLVALAEALDTIIYSVCLPAGSPALVFASEINREATWSLVLLGGYMAWVGVLRATGAVWVSLGISAAVLAVRFPLTAVLLERWHTHAIWWSFPASAIATTILAALYAQHRARRPPAPAISSQRRVSEDNAQMLDEGRVIVKRTRNC